MSSLLTLCGAGYPNPVKKILKARSEVRAELGAWQERTTPLGAATWLAPNDRIERPAGIGEPRLAAIIAKRRPGAAGGTW